MLDSMLSKYDVSDVTHWVDIIDDETGEPVAFEGKDGLQIEILHVDNPNYKKGRNLLIEKSNKGKRGKRGQELDLEEAEQLSAKLAAKLTVGWKNLYTSAGEQIPFSFQTAVELYQAYPWIHVQVNEAAQERANFMQKG